MRSIFIAIAALGVTSAFGYEGSRFEDVWNQVSSDSYRVLPRHEITLGSLVSFTQNYIFNAGARTLSDKRDVLPEFQKLVHSNGVCFAGTWNITETNPYTGYFEKGSRGLIIARASVAFSEVDKGNQRAFGFAGKIYPTSDAKDPRNLKTANFFTVDDLGGTRAEHFLDVGLTNSPPIAIPEGLGGKALALAVGGAFAMLDKNASSRPLYPISELGMSDTSKAVTPNLMKIQAAPGQQTIDFMDFRRELRLRHHDNRLIFDISVRADKEEKWQSIGYIELTEDAASFSCDHRLHFTHAKSR
jgi:hypothetical protein